MYYREEPNTYIQGAPLILFNIWYLDGIIFCYTIYTVLLWSSELLMITKSDDSSHLITTVNKAVVDRKVSLLISLLIGINLIEHIHIQVQPSIGALIHNSHCYLISSCSIRNLITNTYY